jgi:hypothetical protein
MPPEALAATKTEVSETDKEISIVAELPGVSQQDLEVSLDDDVLTIRAETRGVSKIPVHAGTNAEASTAAPTDGGAKAAPPGQNQSARTPQSETPAH